ncbi:MAG TPA: cupin domain-containing protein [Moraxellaceae bacterium]|nr:cupin domain-containing protein [Moraxellaceae bacterium]
MKFLPVASFSLAALLLAAAPLRAADMSSMGQAMDNAMDKGERARTDMHKAMTTQQNAQGEMGKGMGMSMHNPDQLKWGDAPPALPKGAKVAVLDGDPFKPGPYVIRIKMPAGYKVPAHWHSRAENVTVMSGLLFLGMGDKLDQTNAEVLKPGGFHAIGAQVHHYAFTKTGAVIQIHGEGPFDITYINPADNPDPAAKK